MGILSKLPNRNRRSLERRVRLLAPWWHDIYFPELGASTHKLCGVDVRLLQSYEVRGFPEAYFKKTPLAKITGKNVLEIGPASGYYTLKLAQQNNKVTCIEREPRFLNQLNFLRSHFHLKDSITIIRGDFPEIIPPGEFEVVVCLGVLYHVKDYVPFLAALDSVSTPDIYLETHISKTDMTVKAGTNEGYAFADKDINGCILKNMPDYGLVERINLDDSGNAEYNRLPYYRSVLCLRRTKV